MVLLPQGDVLVDSTAILYYDAVPNDYAHGVREDETGSQFGRRRYLAVVLEEDRSPIVMGEMRVSLLHRRLILVEEILEPTNGIDSPNQKFGKQNNHTSLESGIRRRTLKLLSARGVKTARAPASQTACAMMFDAIRPEKTKEDEAIRRARRTNPLTVAKL